MHLSIPFCCKAGLSRPQHQGRLVTAARGQWVTAGRWRVFSSVAALCSSGNAWPLFLGFFHAVPDGVLSPFPRLSSRSPSSTAGWCSPPHSLPTTSMGHPLHDTPSGHRGWGIMLCTIPVIHAWTPPRSIPSSILQMTAFLPTLKRKRTLLEMAKPTTAVVVDVPAICSPAAWARRPSGAWGSSPA